MSDDTPISGTGTGGGVTGTARWFTQLSQLTTYDAVPGTAGTAPARLLVPADCNPLGLQAGTARVSASIERTHDGVAIDRSITLTTLLDLLVVTGVTFDVEPGYRLSIEAHMSPALDALIAPWRGWLLVIAVGRHTGHGPAICDECGEVSMLSVVNSSGTSRGMKSTPWPRCLITPRCAGRRVIRRADIEAVERVRHRGIPRAPAVPDTRIALPWPGIDDMTGRRRRATSLARELRRKLGDLEPEQLEQRDGE